MFSALTYIRLNTLLLLILSPLAISGQQQEIDSLKQIADLAKEEKRIDALLMIARKYLDLNKMKEYEEYSDLANKESRKINYKKGNANILFLKGRSFSLKSDYQNAMLNYHKAIQIGREIKDSSGIALSMNGMAITFQLQGNFSKGLEHHFQALAIREAIGDKRDISISLNNIGNLYLDMGNYLKALEYCQRSYQLAAKEEFLKGIALSLNNIGLVYMRMGKYTSAKEYLFKCIPQYEKLGDMPNLSDIYLNLGIVFQKERNIKEAEKNYNKAYDMYSELKDARGQSLVLQNLGSLKVDQNKLNDAVYSYQSSAILSEKIGDQQTYCNTFLLIGDVYIRKKEYGMAINILENAIKIARDNHFQPQIRDAYYQLSRANAKLNDYPNAYKYLELYRVLNDSLNRESNTRQINELSASFENEKKEKEIELLKKTQSLRELEVKSQQSEIEKQKLYITFSVIAIVLAILSLGLLANRFYIKKKSGDQLFSAYSLLREKNKQITDSINYAQRLQSAILPGEEEIKKHLPGSFIFFRPRDIVSGDFYWFSHVNNKCIIAVADCTGHGVPGALMSMIGNTLLNQAVNEQKLDDPGEILTQLNKSLYRTFSRNNGEENPDGMDISVCAIDTTSNTLSFAGANQSLFLVSGDKAEIIRGDRYSVGGVFSNPDSIFTSQKIQIKDGVSLYLSTDGFPDQFGENGEKYQASGFTQLVESISLLDPSTQKEKIAAEFDQWKGANKQIDDVLVWGVKI